jgi:superoxide dismutase, Cu-Zn family
MSKSFEQKTLLAALPLVLAVGCGTKPADNAAAAPPPATEVSNPTAAAIMDAAATIKAADGTVLGTVRFAEREGRIDIVAEVRGVAPGEHGFHVHETGLCEGPDFASAGGHFNPAGHPHGAPSDAQRHGGDFGNLTVAADGTGKLMLSSNMLTVTPGANSVVGHAVIFHANPDDLKTQPTGNAGGRLGCGVVQLGG